MLAIKGEVLTAHAGQGDLVDILWAQELGADLGVELCDLGIISHGWGAKIDMKFVLSAVDHADRCGDAVEMLFEGLALIAVDGADCASHADLLGDHIRGIAALNGADREGGGDAGVKGAAHKVVEGVT